MPSEVSSSHVAQRRVQRRRVRGLSRRRSALLLSGHLISAKLQYVGTLIARIERVL